jgi:hypothetical protein
MRGRILLGCLLLALGSGCETPKGQIKPPVMPDNYSGPPVADARYSNPPVYQKNLLNQGPQPREIANTNPGPGGPMPGAGGQRTAQGFTPTE